MYINHGRIINLIIIISSTHNGCFLYIMLLFFYVITTSKEHLMWEFKIWLIVFQLNTTDEAPAETTFVSTVTAAQTYGISYCEFQLLFPDQPKPWSRNHPPGSLTSSLLTTSPQTLLTVTFLQSCRFGTDQVASASTWKRKAIPYHPHSMHSLPHKHTPTRS